MLVSKKILPLAILLIAAKDSQSEAREGLLSVMSESAPSEAPSLVDGGAVVPSPDDALENNEENAPTHGHSDMAGSPGETELTTEDVAGESERDDAISISQATVDLPVATPVVPPTSALVERVQQMEAQQDRQNPDIQHAVPRDEEAERNASRRNIMRFAGVALMVVVITSIVLGVTLGKNSNNASDTPSYPFPSPTTQDFALLENLIASISLDGGAALEDVESPQSRALQWLVSNKQLAEYQDWKRIQRYVLAVIYYSLDGDNWFESTGWMSDEDECSWFTNVDINNAVCDENGSYRAISLVRNSLEGTFPREVALLSDSLGTSMIDLLVVVLWQ